MDFDPLELFTPSSVSVTYTPKGYVNSHGLASVTDGDFEVSREPLIDDNDASKANNSSGEDDVLMPIHIHDLPLLRNLPPAQVLFSFLRLLAPETSLNFAPRNRTSGGDDILQDPEKVLRDKDVKIDSHSWEWLRDYCPRFDNNQKLASISVLGDSFKKAFTSQYNAWLTQLVSSDFGWMSEMDAAEIRSLAALRLAENCGRTAQPEMLRSIEIPMLSNKLLLKEPSLTSDNLGLKTWGSSFILGSRLALQQEKHYLAAPVLELGAGTGLVGMVSCCLGFGTMLTDLPEIVPNLKSNIELNDISNAQVAELDWSNPAGFLAKYGDVKYSTIILSDPLYSSQHPSWIVNMINLFLSEDEKARVLLQVPIRRSFEKERAALWSLMQDNGYVVKEESQENGYDDFGESSFIFKKYTRATT